MWGSPEAVPSAEPLRLVTDLCAALDRREVPYCHWKSNDALDRSRTGDNDLDLLIAERDAPAFEATVRALGFIEAAVPGAQRLPGIRHFYGLDEPSGRLVDLHTHEQLVLGDDATKNYRLPIEEAYLATVTRRDPFRVPDPELEFAVFIVRMMLKHGSPEAIATGRGSLSRKERDELRALEHATDPTTRWRALHRAVPPLDRSILQRCLSTFDGTTTIHSRLATWRALEPRLTVYARRPRAIDVWLQVWRRLVGRSRRLAHRPRRKRVAGGGSVIAIVGSDGAGKSTTLDEVERWLAPVFAIRREHLGKPRRSVSWILARAAMHGGRRLGVAAAAVPTPTGTPANGPSERPSQARLAMELLTTRDRLRAARRARRAARRGAVVVCDRYPLPQLAVDGPRRDRVAGGPLGAVSRRIVEHERRMHARIPPPNVVIVLQVSPDVARRRRPGEDPAVIEARAREIIDAAWGSSAFVVDANRSFDAVLADVRRDVWSTL